MGVAGLWEVLRPAGTVRSLTELAVEDGFNASPSHHRAFRIGVDASIWFFHAAYGREGENPELRTLFFRCCRLLQSPLLPLFVFDGPNRPAIKRGKRIGGNTHWLTQGMKNMIDAFGFEWCVAPGEAEAELAYLNRIGIIDAVLSDDVDSFLFGAIMVIRNPSNTLSGNRAHPVKNAQGKDDGNHVVTYTADAISSNPSVSLSRPGAILVGLLSGGDYIPAGLPGCGQKFATGLARAGFGDSLFKAVKKLRGARLDAFLNQWRQDIRNELKTNKSGLLPSKKPSLAASLPDDFPSLPVLMSYVDPLTTENPPQNGKHKTPPGVWRSDPDPMRIASLCELYFEWGVKDVIVHRFRTVLWPGIVCRAIRRAVMDEDARRRPILHDARRCDSEEEEDITGRSSPTRQISSALSALAFTSPSKRHSATGTSSAFDPSSHEPFTLSSLVSLTSALGSSRPTSLSSSSLSTSGPPLILEVLSQRTHASTDSTLEYRVLVDPTMLVERAESGVRGLRPPLIGGLFGDPEGEDDETLNQGAEETGSDDGIGRLETAASKPGAKKRKVRREHPTTPLRLWLPACMMRAATPELVTVYEDKVKVREAKKAMRGTTGARAGRAGTATVSKRTQIKDVEGDDDDESVPGLSAARTAVVTKAKTRTVRVGGGRRKPKQVSEAQDDAYEFIDLNVDEDPCSSDEDVVKEDTKSRGKAKAKATTRKTDTMKPIAKAAEKSGKLIREAATISTMNEFFSTTKPPITNTAKSKLSTSRLPAANPSMVKPTASKRLCEKEEEEESTGVNVPPCLPKSSRPLDVLRAKSKPCIVPLNPASKSKLKVVPRYEEEKFPAFPTRQPPGIKPSTSNIPCQSTRKKPMYVNISDTGSDMEVSDVRRPPSSVMAETITVHREREDDMNTRFGGGFSTFQSQNAPTRVVDGVIDLIAKSSSRSSSNPLTSAPNPLLPPECSSASLVIGTGTVTIPGVNTGTIGPIPTARSASKLNHILLPRIALESKEGEESEGDELPTFHRGSPTSITKNGRAATISRPMPRPFPMQLTSESSTFACASRHKETDHEIGDGDGVEIEDVFTSPRGFSPPPSATPSPSSAKSALFQASNVNPTNSTFHAGIELHGKSRPDRRVSSDEDTHVSGNERNRTLKSPRKLAAHSSPRHIHRERERASSPTSPGLSDPSRVDAAALWTGAERRMALGGRGPLPEGPGSTCANKSGGWKPEPSDTPAIYISSGSEDEDSAGLGVGGGRGGDRSEVSQDLDEWTDRDVDGWADTGMILSAPPSPALAHPSPKSDLVHSVPLIELPHGHPARASKFNPALITASMISADLTPSTQAQASERATSTSVNGVTQGRETVAPRSWRRAPLLAARAKQDAGTGRDDDVIDLTSD